MAYNTQYYSTEGGGDYKAFLEHFKKQAEGTDRPLVFNTRVNCTVFKNARTGRGHLILVNTRKDSGTTKNGERVTKLEIVDPNEAERRRALSEAVRDEVEVTKEADQETSVHSALGGRKRRTNTQRADSSRNSKSATAVTKSKIRRVKDVFDD